MTSFEFTCVNESVSDQVSASDRGLAFGDGLFETMKVENGSIPLWRYHRERLLQGLSALQIAAPVERFERAFQLQSEAFTAEQTPVSGISKLIVTRGSSGGGYQYTESIEPNVILSFRMASFQLPKPEHLYRSDVAVYDEARLSGVKHLARLENVLARQGARRAGYSDALLENIRGEVLETTNSNLFFVTPQGTLVTPAMGNSGVNGVMKRVVLEVVCPELGIDTKEVAVNWSRISEFVAAFKTNAVMGVTPIASIAYHRLESSEVTRRIQARVMDLMFKPTLPLRRYFDID